MNWNPWKEIKRLREELNRVKYHLGLSNMEENNLREIMVHTDQRLHAVRDVLDKIGLEEKPTSNATVKRMAQMAREALGK
jgi:hypothetical protein